jgi:group I intron endonuclease
MIVYLVTNLVNGKRYVGKTRLPLQRRWRQHLRDAARGSSCMLHRAIRKYGESAFVLSVLVECQTLEEMNAMEIAKIAELRTHESAIGYNATLGGDGCLGRTGADAPMFGKRHSHETRKKMRLAHLGKPHPQATHREQRGARNPSWRGGVNGDPEHVRNLARRRTMAWRARNLERARAAGREQQRRRRLFLPKPSEEEQARRRDAMLAHLRRNNDATAVYLTFRGETKRLVDWARQLGIKRVTLYWRIRQGWPLERAFIPSS